MKADRWGNQWSKGGALLRFGTSTTGTSISLDEVAAKHLSLTLIETIHQHEKNFGVSWSEHDLERGGIADARLRSDEFNTSNVFAHELYLLVKNLPLNGYERSFKMTSRKLWSERFLVGVSMNLIAAADIDFLIAQMNMPDLFHADIHMHLADANFIHIGFEQGDISTYKFYLEFPQGNSDVKAPHPLYLGYKWNAENRAQRALSRYTQAQTLSLSNLLNKIDAMYGDEKENDVVRSIAKQIITKAADKVSTTQLLFVEVQEENTPRLSFDINLYETGMTVCDLQPMLLELREHFVIDEKEFAELMKRTEDDLAGHLSGGNDRNGNAFLTTYHACVTAGTTEAKNV